MKFVEIVENRANQSNHNGISSIASDDQWFTLPEQTAILPLENSNAWKLKMSFYRCKRHIFRGLTLPWKTTMQGATDMFRFLYSNLPPPKN